MDPFGSTYPSNGFKSRGSSLSHSSDGGLKGFTGAMTGVAKDVGAQLSSRGRSWSHVGGYLGAANSIYGCLVVAWVVIALLQHGAFGLGLGLGVSLVLLGFVGMISMRKDAHSMRTLYLSGAVIVGLLSWAFISQVGYTTRNDCVLAETFLRLDHLENAVHKLKHEDMIKGIMMRLDSMQTEMAYLEEHAEEKVAESARRQQFKENDLKYLDMKLVSLGDIAERSLAHLDAKIAEINRNVTALENAGEADSADAANLKARLRSLRYRQRTMQPRKDKLREVLEHVEEYRTSTKAMTEEEYEALLKQLEIQAGALDSDLQQDIADTRSEAERVAATAHRLEKNVYTDMRVGHFAEREKTRTDARQKARDKYESFITRVQKDRDPTMGKKELYVRSLNRYLDSMPEHCMEDLEEMHPGQIVGLVAMVLAAASAYVALTATVMSVKKDY